MTKRTLNSNCRSNSKYNQSWSVGELIHLPKMEDRKPRCTLFRVLFDEEGEWGETSLSCNLLPPICVTLFSSFINLFFLVDGEAMWSCIWSCHILPEDPCLLNENDDLCNVFMINYNYNFLSCIPFCLVSCYNNLFCGTHPRFNNNVVLLTHYITVFDLERDD